MLVVKVGGSLYDLPDLRWRLERFLAAQGDPDWLLVPGGGAMADVVREWDRRHGLGDARSHWLALRACSLNAHLLRDLLPGVALVADPVGHRGRGVLDAFAFLDANGGVPHSWEATSDAVAARAAAVARGELVLLKSVTIPAAMSWEDAARMGYVDRVFPEVVRASGIRVRAVNLRE